MLSSALVLAMLSTLLASCGGGDDGDSGNNAAPNPGDTLGGPPLPSQSYFPLQVGDLWLYQDSGTTSLTLARVTGQQSVNGQTGFTVREVDAAGISRYQSLILPLPSGVFEIATANSDPFTQHFGRLELLRYPVRIGSSFVQVNTTIPSGLDFDSDGLSDPVTVRSTVTILGLETINTAAGNFADTVHQRTSINEVVTLSRSGQRVTIEITGDEWFAQDIGLVRRTTTVRNGSNTEVIRRDLVGYAVGGLKSEYTPPTILSTTPAGTATEGPNVIVSAVFSEDMDGQTVSGATFSVTDSGGRAVPGSVQLNGATARFVPTDPWSSGRFTARISTSARDLLGNALAAERTWQFDIDATGPRVLSTTPAEGAQGVGPTQPIVIRFSEPLLANSVNDYSVQLISQGIPAATTVTVDGSTVTLTPRTSLQRGQTYEAGVTSSVADERGNAVQPEFRLRFQTDQGRFAPGVPLAPAVTTDAMAIGDVNSDGINDVVLTSGIATDPANQFSLFVLPGRADGSLAAPVRVDVSLGCWLDAVVIGDVNGDGRNDVVVGGQGCGAQVFRQTSGGQLVPAQLLNRAATQRLRMADLNADGRLDLVGTGGADGNVNVWLQSGSGVLTLHATPTFDAGFTKDIEIGDVTGDGRPDLIAVVSGSQAGQHVAVLRQNADGSYAAATYLAANSTWGASAVAVGDLNGDGRKDVVVTTGGNSPTSIGVYYQSPTGSLGAMTPISTYDSPMAVRVADVDGDGRDDVVVSHVGWTHIGVYLQRGDGTLAPEDLFRAPYGSFNPNAMAVGDVNRDGRPDIVISGELLLQRNGASASRSPIGASGLRRFGSAPSAARH